MAVYTMSKRSSLIPPMNVVKETVFIDGEEVIFDSLTLLQGLNDCQSFELIQKITTEKELWLKSPQKLTEMIGNSVLIRFEYGKEAYRYEFSGYLTDASEVSNNVRSITTKSGHKLVFTDDESILLCDKNGNTLQINSVENTIEITAIEKLTFQSKKMFFKTTEDMEFFVGGNKKETIMKESEHIADKSILKAHTKMELNSGEKTSVVSKEMNLFTTQSDILIKAGKTTYVQGKEGVEVDMNGGNKTAFQTTRYFIEDVSQEKKEQRKQQEKEKKVISLTWVDENRNPIDYFDENKNVFYILAQTQNYREGDIISIDIEETNQEKIQNGHHFITLTSKVEADGKALLGQTHEKF